MENQISFQTIYREFPWHNCSIFPVEHAYWPVWCERPYSSSTQLPPPPHPMLRLSLRQRWMHSLKCYHGWKSFSCESWDVSGSWCVFLQYLFLSRCSCFTTHSTRTITLLSTIRILARSCQHSTWELFLVITVPGKCASNSGFMGATLFNVSTDNLLRLSLRLKSLRSSKSSVERKGFITSFFLSCRGFITKHVAILSGTFKLSKYLKTFWSFCLLFQILAK